MPDLDLVSPTRHDHLAQLLASLEDDPTAASDELGLRADQLKYEVGSGPCLEAALETERHPLPHDLTHGDRWPEFRYRLSMDLGIRGCLSYPVPTPRQHHSLNVYRKDPGPFAAEAVTIGSLYASCTAVVLGVPGHEVGSRRACLT